MFKKITIVAALIVSSTSAFALTMEGTCAPLTSQFGMSGTPTALDDEDRKAMGRFNVRYVGDGKTGAIYAYDKTFPAKFNGHVHVGAIETATKIFLLSLEQVSNGLRYNAIFHDVGKPFDADKAFVVSGICL